MNISLTTELEKFVHEKVASGMYQNASEVMRQALRLMTEQEDNKQEQLKWLRARLDIAWEDKTRLTPEEVKAHMAERRKAWQNNNEIPAN